MENPLDIEIDVTGLDTSIPVLKTDAPVRLQCIQSQIEPNKDANGFNWRLVMATTEPVTTLDETREVPPNFKLFHTVALQARPDSTDKEAFRRSIGDTIDALFGSNKDNRPKFNKDLVASAVGQTCMGQLINDEWPKGSGEVSTKIKRLKPEA